MSFRKISVGQGLVTSKDPSELGDGEMVEAQGAYYKPNDMALWRVKGKSLFNTADNPDGNYGYNDLDLPILSFRGISAIKHIEFDGTTTDRFLIKVGGAAVNVATAALVDASATAFSSVIGVGYEKEENACPTLDVVHYNNQHFILRGGGAATASKNGVDSGRNHYIGTTDSTGASVTTPDSTSTFFHGMLANTTAPTADATAGTGITLGSGNTLIYWVEERVKQGSTIIRRNASTSSETVTVTGTVTDKAITITRPATVNSDATHWALYSTATNGAFPTGNEISEVAIATTTITDNRSGTDPALPTGDAYQVVTVALAGVVQSVSRNGPPPSSSTGDVFEDSLVLDDMTNKSILRYSFPDSPHAFPSFNFIRFETKEQDEIRVIKTIGRTLLVILRDSAWRLDVLPRPEDASFEIERVKTRVDGAFGCVNVNAADTFSWGQGERLAYVSMYGIVVTDGYLWDYLTDDLDWQNTVDETKLWRSILINNPREHRLEFYYTPKGAGDSEYNNRCYYLHYHPSHAKESIGGNFRAKLTGPILVDGHGVGRVLVDDQWHVFTGTSGKEVYVEGNGTTDPSGSDGVSFSIRTGDYYLNGLGGDASVVRMWTHTTVGADPSQTATVRLHYGAEGEGQTNISHSISVAGRGLHSSHLQAHGEFHQFACENNDGLGSFGVNYFLVEYNEMGTTEQDG